MCMVCMILTHRADSTFGFGHEEGNYSRFNHMMFRRRRKYKKIRMSYNQIIMLMYNGNTYLIWLRGSKSSVLT